MDHCESSLLVPARFSPTDSVIAYVAARIVVDQTNVELLGGERSQGREEGLEGPHPGPAKFLPPDPVMKCAMAGIVAGESNGALLGGGWFRGREEGLECRYVRICGRGRGRGHGHGHARLLRGWLM
jgi:hypothetical protein